MNPPPPPFLIPPFAPTNLGSKTKVRNVRTKAYRTSIMCLSWTTTSHLPNSQYLLNSQLEHLCAKLLHVDCNNAHRWKGLHKNAHAKKKTFPTNTGDQNSVKGTLGMLGTHLPTFAQSEKVWQELSSRYIDPNWQNRVKTRGLGGQNTQKKLFYEPNTLYLAYNMPPRLPYLTPPSATLSWHCVHRCGGAHSAKNTITDSKEVTTTNRYWDLTRYNIKFIIQHCSVFSLSIFFFKTS